MYFANDNYNNKVFNVGIYVRLSRDDEDKLFEYSDSIMNQKEFLTRYVIDNNWCIVDYYIDDGFTGTNFDRPDFQRMIRDVHSKRINMVITKDLSRLGRDYIETGNYMEKYFPAYNIRYIAVTDGIDTFAHNNSNNDMSPFKSVVNDMYARDTSKKVRAIFDSKRMNGQFIGAFAPYGYKKSHDNKSLLVIDENTAPIVRRIFDMYLAGSGYAHIASTLNLEGVLSPIAYKSQNGNYKNPKSQVELWSQDAIRKMLRSPTYAGNLTQNKYSTINYKIKKLKNMPKSNWIIVENTHEAIVDIESFDLVQRMIEKRVVKGKQPEYSQHLLSGLIYCGDCGFKMTYNKTPAGISYTICSNYKRFPRMNICTRHSFLERELDDIIIGELKKLAKRSVSIEALEKAAKNKLNNKKPDNTLNDMKKVELRLVEIKKIIKKLYEDKLRGVIEEQDFIDMSKEYSTERSTLVKRLTDLTVKSDTQKASGNGNESLVSIIKDFVDFESIDRTILVKLLDKIEIFSDNRIKVHYNFKNP